MSDRSGALLFGKVFRLIAEHVPKEQRREVALGFWELMGDYDFSPYDLNANEALVKCELATREDEYGTSYHYEGSEMHEISRKYPKVG